jgi:DUF1365 family protein
MMYLDLDELDTVFDGRWLWSTRGPAAAWFRRADYLGDPEVDLATAVRDTAERLTGQRPAGPIRMLTHLRCLGYVLNPVTFYYCFGSDGTTIETILAEITNTPWSERHTYALTGDPGSVCDTRHRFAKAFHISPFMTMDHTYEWRFSEPEHRLFVHMENMRDGEKVFDASLLLHRQEITGASLARTLVRHPAMTLTVVAGIYWQAFRLWLKRTPYVEHPDKAAA